MHCFSFSPDGLSDCFKRPSKNPPLEKTYYKSQVVILVGNTGVGKNGSSYKIDYVSSLHAAHMSATGENNLQINFADFLSCGEKPVSSVHCEAKREGDRS